MWDASSTPLRNRRWLPRAAVSAAMLAIACGLGGCAGNGANAGAFAMASATSGPTVTFESIDGPPPQIFERMVSVLDSESKLRNLSIVSRAGTALLPCPQLSCSPGQPRSRHDRLGLGCLRPEPATRAAPFRRGTGGQGRTRRLGGCQRYGFAQDRPGRIERPEQHDQWNGTCGAAPSAAVGAHQTRSGCGQHQSAFFGFR